MENLNPFLVRHKENADMNQYWYSKATIQFMVQQVTDMCQPKEGEETSRIKNCAFLSTPSIYFSLKDKGVKEAAKVFDVSNLSMYDFNHLDRHQVCQRPKFCLLRLQQEQRNPKGTPRSVRHGCN